MIFISYSRTRALAEAIRRELCAAGLPAWVDFEQLDLSSPIEPQLEAAIADSQHLLLLDSPAARTSPWVALELQLAARHNRPIYTVPAVPYSRKHRGGWGDRRPA